MLRSTVHGEENYFNLFDGIVFRQSLYISLIQGTLKLFMLQIQRSGWFSPSRGNTIEVAVRPFSVGIIFMDRLSTFVVDVDKSTPVGYTHCVASAAQALEAP